MMGNTLKFHIATSILNLIIVFVSAYVNQIISELFDPAIFAKRGSDFNLIWLIYAFGFFWISTFSIYVFKKPNFHIFKFMLFGLMVILINVLYYYIISGNHIGFDRVDLTLFLKNGFTETFTFIIVSSIGIHFSQLLVGRKLLPHLYKLA